MKFNKSITKRVDAGMGCGAYVGPGWVRLVENLDTKLSKLYPEYKIDQIKEKFGSLRYYVSGAGEEGYELISETEAVSAHICEECGEPGTLKGRNGWLSTRCEEHE